jgi:hypothetical protein
MFYCQRYMFSCCSKVCNYTRSLDYHSGEGMRTGKNYRDGDGGGDQDAGMETETKMRGWGEDGLKVIRDGVGTEAEFIGT